MSRPTWSQRNLRLTALLNDPLDDEAAALALDRLLHGQSVIGKTAKTTEVDNLRFQDRDLSVLGTLDQGQFGVIDVVNCTLDGRVYIRKSTQKTLALRTKDQCSPQLERDILLAATKGLSPWAPHLLCAYQTPTHLNLVMDYAEGGTLWDVLESSPHDGTLLEDDLRWWVPQIVSAIHWCHAQGFTHRDIKPHNFVLTPQAHILLIDFGSAAPLLPREADGTQRVPRRHCLVPCGTCDYISPEILGAHEEALLALEMGDDGGPSPEVGYGRETDWWSLGVMLYEMAYGYAPFFARDIRQTYLKIIDHHKHLRFDDESLITREYQDLLKGLLKDAEFRLGRHDVAEIVTHSWFTNTNWDTLPHQPPPPNLHLPQFIYATPTPAPVPTEQDSESSLSQGFAFSAFFQSSVASSPILSAHQTNPNTTTPRAHIESSSFSASAFIGFSWGPRADAFPAEPPHQTPSPNLHPNNLPEAALATPRPLRIPSTHTTPLYIPSPGHLPLHDTLSLFPAPPSQHGDGNVFVTPVRPRNYHTLPRSHTHAHTFVASSGGAPHGTGTLRRYRTLSDREAYRQLVDCVGMSARKKVLESGRKPKILVGYTTGGGAGDGKRKKEKEGREKAPPPPPILVGDISTDVRVSRSVTSGVSGTSLEVSGLSFTTQLQLMQQQHLGKQLSSAFPSSSSHQQQLKQPIITVTTATAPLSIGNSSQQLQIQQLDAFQKQQQQQQQQLLPPPPPPLSSGGEETESEGPPSPSPTPRPGSAMSYLSSRSTTRRSGTPTVSIGVGASSAATAAAAVQAVASWANTTTKATAKGSGTISYSSSSSPPLPPSASGGAAGSGSKVATGKGVGGFAGLGLGPPPLGGSSSSRASSASSSSSASAGGALAASSSSLSTRRVKQGVKRSGSGGIGGPFDAVPDGVGRRSNSGGVSVLKRESVVDERFGGAGAGAGSQGGGGNGSGSGYGRAQRARSASASAVVSIREVEDDEHEQGEQSGKRFQRDDYDDGEGHDDIHGERRSPWSRKDLSEMESKFRMMMAEIEDIEERLSRVRRTVGSVDQARGTGGRRQGRS